MYNENCWQAVERRWIVREKFISVGNTYTKELYTLEKRSCKRLIQIEKRKYFNETLQEAEKRRSRGSARNFFKMIKQCKSFNPGVKIIKNRYNDLIMNPKEKSARWK